MKENQMLVFDEWRKMKIKIKPEVIVLWNDFFQTAIIIVKLASWGKVSLPENDLNYFMSWVKNSLGNFVSIWKMIFVLIGILMFLCYLCEVKVMLCTIPCESNKVILLQRILQDSRVTCTCTALVFTWYFLLYFSLLWPDLFSFLGVKKTFMACFIIHLEIYEEARSEIFLLINPLFFCKL